MSGRIFQVMEYLDYGDGVSNVVRAFAPLLVEHGAERSILTMKAHQAVRHETQPFNSVKWSPDDAVIVHVWGPTQLEGFLRTFPGRKAVYFHNITPPDFFEHDRGLRLTTQAGWCQLPRLANLADMWLGPSAYNLKVLSALGVTPRRQRVIPPPIDPRVEYSRPVNAGRLAALRRRAEVNFLSVGRLAPNKVQHRIMQVFDYYHTRINPRSRLHLVGDPTVSPNYARLLGARRWRLCSRDAIEFPGKVSDAVIQAYYKAADLFLCLSEHEGFCLPPLIAALHGVPVLARSAAALPETVGPAALMLHDYQPAAIAELAHIVLQDSSLRARLAEAGSRHLAKFSLESVKEAWAEALAELSLC